MKLKNILPIVSAASVCAFATPFVASCAKFDVTIKNGYEYKPNYDKHPAESMSLANAEQAYFDFLQPNADKFAQEFYYSATKAWNEHKYDDRDTEQLSVSFASINKESHLIGFKAKFKTIYYEDSIKRVLNETLEFKNIKYELQASGKVIYFEVDDQYLKTTDNNWYFSYKFKEKSNTSHANYDIYANKDSSETLKNLVISILPTTVELKHIYYLEDVTVG